jgi:glycine/D-amino acid oxidase-like deaminating enzyme
VQKPGSNSGYEILVIGGGMIGAAIAYGLARTGTDVAVLDEGDDVFRAARGNAGLIWVQGKGDGRPAYAAWTRLSADRWPAFAAELQETSDIDIHFRQDGGLDFCLGEAELTQQAAQIDRLRRQSAVAGHSGYRGELIDRATLQGMVPGLGADVSGGTYSPDDGHVNPLRLLHAMHRALQRLGGCYVPGQKVTEIRHDGDGYAVTTPAAIWHADRVVIAAGLGTGKLAAMAGMSVPVLPERGHLLVTERLAPFLQRPSGIFRQTLEGTLLIGESNEDAGYDNRTELPVSARLSARAIRFFPFLRDVQLIRSWACLRVLTPDGLPLYTQSRSHPGIFALTTHSAVTLTAAHATELAPAILRAGLAGPGTLDGLSAAFPAERFDVSTTE